MNKNFICALALILASVFALPLHAKDMQITLASDPEGAVVYMNGMIVAQTTPAIITVDKKMADKNIMFKFEKKGYESKTVIVKFNKKELSQGPIVYAKMDKDAQANEAAKAAARKSDPSVPKGQENARVSRDTPGETSMEKTIIRWYFDSDPRGSRIFYRVISNVPDEVKNTNETYLTTTPLEETKSFNIPGLTYANSRNVTIEIKVSKNGYEDQVKRYNVRQALDQQEISGFFDLVPKE